MEKIFLDTETTGLSGIPRDKIVEIAIVHYDGRVLLNTLVNPERPIGFTTTIHGITDEMVQGAPTFEEIWSQVQEIISGKHLIIFNAAFDQRFFPDGLGCAGKITCAMSGFQRIYKAIGGSSNRYNLRFATEHIGYSWEGNHHRALADTFAARAVWLWVEKTSEEKKLSIANYNTSDLNQQDPITARDPYSETVQINQNNPRIIQIGDTVHLAIEINNELIPIDPLDLSDPDVRQKVSVEMLIGKRCGDGIEGFNCYDAVFNVVVVDFVSQKH